MKVFIRNLAYSVTRDELRELFERFGEVVKADIALDHETGQSKGFGFIEMRLADDALLAIEMLDGTPVAGRKINVMESRPAR